MSFQSDRYQVVRTIERIRTILPTLRGTSTNFVMGHSRIVTNGLADNQPITRDGVCVIHNGIVVNHMEIWSELSKARLQDSDTEVIAEVAAHAIESGLSPADAGRSVLEKCTGTVAAAIALPKLGKLVLLSNNGSLHVGTRGGDTFFASEEFPLRAIGCTNITQVFDPLVFSIPISTTIHSTDLKATKMTNLIPSLKTCGGEESLLIHAQHDLRRCSRCILPETMPFISFDSQGVCNFCLNYRPRALLSSASLDTLLSNYRRSTGAECIVPFSGGRDSSYALHLITTELKMRPITYTYDWGMITDLGRRNISRMCAALGVENIVVAADIRQKRRNIAKNLTAWLAHPDLGMLSILTAGDKHFFRHIDSVRRRTGVSLNLWGVNPLETTHFKAGFLGIPPDFEAHGVYKRGLPKQFQYQIKRFHAMTKSPGYFNSSLWDTLSGEYHRSIRPKTDYFHVFDYWRWDEQVVQQAIDAYGWERAPDTNTTWRVGDGTAAFYNYVYYTAAGLTEHDTFRSNQIREGMISRHEALDLVTEENQPRYPNIKWYLDAIELDFRTVINTVNSMPRVQALK